MRNPRAMLRRRAAPLGPRDADVWQAHSKASCARIGPVIPWAFTNATKSGRRSFSARIWKPRASRRLRYATSWVSKKAAFIGQLLPTAERRPPEPRALIWRRSLCNWLRVLDTAERAQVDQRVRQQLHAIVPLLDTFKAEQHPLELVF